MDAEKVSRVEDKGVLQEKPGVLQEKQGVLQEKQGDKIDEQTQTEFRPKVQSFYGLPNVLWDMYVICMLKIT